MINTIDILGDSTVTDSIIDRSITEFIDNVLVKIGNNAFRSCSALTTVDFPLATSIGNGAFRNCTRLTTVDFPLATSIASYAFQNCTSLTTVEFPRVTSIGNNAFESCSALTTVKFPLATTSIGTSAFNGCTSLTTVDFPRVTSIASIAFSNCTSLTALILRNTEQVVSLSNTNAFNNTSNVIIYVPDTLVNSYKSATNWSTYADRIKGLSELPETE